MSYKTGDVVSTSQHGDLVIADTRPIRKGRVAGRVEYTLAPLKKGQLSGRAYAIRAIGTKHFGPPKGRYSADQIQAAIESVTEAKLNMMERKGEAAERGRDTIEQRAISPGDIVRVKYKDVGERDEVVAAVSLKTGKVGIERRKGGTRWLPTSAIVGNRSPDKRCPIKPESAVAFSMLLDRGWHQLHVGRSDVTVRSCVIAFSREDARKGSDYDGASAVVYHDKELDLYWRETGSLD
jgi:hypothetical protein